MSTPQAGAADSAAAELSRELNEPVADATPTAGQAEPELSMVRHALKQLDAPLTDVHRVVRGDSLRQQAAQLSWQDPEDILQTLAVEFGLAWTTIAKMVAVTPTAVRKWRRGEPISNEHRTSLAAALAFLEHAQQCQPISKIGQWLEMRLPDTTLTPLDLYATGASDPLLDWLADLVSVTAMLDEAAPGWRTAHAPDPHYTVGEGPDGKRAIVARS